MVDQTKVFDIWNIFVNEIIGDVWLTILILLIITNISAVKSKMPFRVIVLFDILVLAAVVAQTNLTIIWVFLGLFVGIQFYLVVAKAATT